MEKLSGKKNTAVLISGRGSNLRSLVKYSKSKKSLIRIVLVVSNNFSAKGLDYANKSKINNVFIKDSNKKSFEDRLLKLLKKNNVDLICLAGFMKILSGKFIKKFVPELFDCPSNEIHNPSKETRSSLKYPEMIVDLKSSRLRAIDAFKSIK